MRTFEHLNRTHTASECASIHTPFVVGRITALRLLVHGPVQERLHKGTRGYRRGDADPDGGEHVVTVGRGRIRRRGWGSKGPSGLLDPIAAARDRTDREHVAEMPVVELGCSTMDGQDKSRQCDFGIHFGGF